MIDLSYNLSGLLVGLLVGLTGVGGGSLMAPIMILLLGVSPATAVGTDLWFAAITKMVGGGIHNSHGSTDWKVVRRLAIGSIPAALLTLVFLAASNSSQIKGGFIIIALGIVLVITGVATLFRARMHKIATGLNPESRVLYRRWQSPLTMVAGAILGVLVTLTSIGAGALGATMLVLLYPKRLDAKKIVGTDIVHAVPLTLVAGLGHLWIGNVNASLLGSLLIGSIPGIVIGSVATRWLPDKVLTIMLAVILAVVGVKMILT